MTTKIRVPTDSLNYLEGIIRQQIIQQENILYKAGLNHKWKQKKYEERITQLKVILASVIEELEVVYEEDFLKKIEATENHE